MISVQASQYRGDIIFISLFCRYFHDQVITQSGTIVNYSMQLNQLKKSEFVLKMTMHILRNLIRFGLRSGTSHRNAFLLSILSIMMVVQEGK